ncbi:MAG TPA: cytochrome c biogenesis protein CcdA [Thermodesulfobacteriota bacterium]
MAPAADVSFLVAFVAGVLSFVSPCVLPLVPSYLSVVSGLSFDRMTDPLDADARRRVLVHAALFIAGFSLVFIALGLSASAIGRLLGSQRSWLPTASGVLIILLGVYILATPLLPALGVEARLVHLRARPAGYLGSVLVGMAFAAAWTPCIGPTLGAILTLASTREHAGSAAALLVVYSLGLGVPLLTAAAAFNRFLALFGAVKRYMPAVTVASGLLLVAVGVMTLTGHLTRLNLYLLRLFPFLILN